MNREQLNILVCDDNPEAASNWARAIRQCVGETRVTIETPTPDELRGSLDVLADRQREARGTDMSPWEPTAFDTADIAFLDYDLLTSDQTKDLTGHELAYRVRCYSECGVIAVMNEQFGGSPTFDLRLEPSVSHFADLRVSSDHLGNPGLWTDEYIGFRPWSWPALSQEAAAFEERVALAAQLLDTSVVETLKLGDFSDWLSRNAIAALVGRSDAEAGAVTFRDVVAAGSPLGVWHKDALRDSQVPRVAAARVTHWLRNLVLPAQEPYIDAPHLVARFPSLLGNASDLSVWDRTAKLTFDLAELGLAQSPVASSAINIPPWSDRPLWHWPDVREERSIPEVSDPWGQPVLPVVFLEDMSRFATEDASRSFASQVPSLQDIRFVLDVEAAEALVAGEQERAATRGVPWAACDPTRVKYSPPNLLAE